MAGLGLTDFGFGLFWTPDSYIMRPRQAPATSGRPLSSLVEVDPVLMMRPEAALLRGFRQAQRSIGRRQRSG